MNDELRPEYDLGQLLKGGVRGKYANRYHAGTNLVLLEPDVRKAFRSERAVNGALRLVIELRKVGSHKQAWRGPVLEVRGIWARSVRRAADLRGKVCASQRRHGSPCGSSRSDCTSRRRVGRLVSRTPQTTSSETKA